MKAKLTLGILAMVFMAGLGLCSSIENFTRTVRYAAPTNFYMFDLTKEPYAAPFAIGGSGIEYDPVSNDPNSHILFELDLACYRVGQGKVYEFLPASPSDVKRDFETFYQDKFTNMPPATIGKMSGFTDCKRNGSVSFGRWDNIFSFLLDSN